MEKSLRSTLNDVADFLDREGVRYALIGGLAASLRGQPRATADVDLVIDTDVEGALKLIEALEGSSFKPLFEGVEEVVNQAFILPLSHRETSVKVDLSIGLSGFEQQLLERATLVELGKRHIPVVTAEDLLVMKLLAGRPRDQQDAMGIVMIQGGSLDLEYCRQIARDLGDAVGIDLVMQLEKILSSEEG